MEAEYKSRTQIKKEVKALQKLGERLLDFSPEQIENMDIPEELKEAITFSKTIRAREARRRQIKYIGGLMRKIDPEQIQQFLDQKDQQSQAAKHVFHQLEQWRDTLIAGDNNLLEELCARFPAAERQHLRQLIRNARKEQEQEKAPKSARALFRYLRTLVEEHGAETL